MYIHSMYAHMNMYTICASLCVCYIHTCTRCTVCVCGVSLPCRAIDRTFFETSHSTTFSSVRGLFPPLAAENGSSVSLTTWCVVWCGVVWCGVVWCECECGVYVYVRLLTGELVGVWSACMPYTHTK